MKVRVLTAVVLIPLLLIVLLVLPLIFTAILCGLVCMLAAYELLWITGMVREKSLMIYTAAVAFLVNIWSYYGRDHAVGLLLLLLFTILLFVQMLASRGKIHFTLIALCYVGGLVIPYFLSSLVCLRIMGYGDFFVLIPFLVAFLSDSGAYFAGSFLGKHKLAPEISPNKTVEGVIGGIIAAVFGMLVYALLLDLAFKFDVNYLNAIAYGVLGSLGGVFGDLVFSAIKRQTNIKDYGSLIPGHGGILDRFDSMTVVAPLIEVLLLLLPVTVR